RDQFENEVVEPVFPPVVETVAVRGAVEEAHCDPVDAIRPGDRGADGRPIASLLAVADTAAGDSSCAPRGCGGGSVSSPASSGAKPVSRRTASREMIAGSVAYVSSAIWDRSGGRISSLASHQITRSPYWSSVPMTR